MSGQKLKQRAHKKKLPGSQYSEAFKRQVAEAYHQGEDDQYVVAARFGVGQTSVNFWSKKYQTDESITSVDELTFLHLPQKGMTLDEPQ